MAEWRELTHLDEWNDVRGRLSGRTAVIFKHSTICPISADAWREFQECVSQRPDAAEYYVVKVIESRPVSNQIAQDLGVVHQSPQAIVIRDAKVVWHASHRQITRDALAQALNG
ncbi:MAG: bacillithiol system redox-active protein YtxJ [Alicyclobacillaceae bacterium]|nr:bacillithiol system redox-active protein YtxJ [Alicyclobacillaceae bacterium]